MKTGISKTRLYGIYSGMKQRCYNKKNQHFRWYGAKGIKICDEWLGEKGLYNFMEWSLNNGYEENLSIDRIDSQGPYSPINCQWITLSQNAKKAHTKKSHNACGAIVRKARERLGLSQEQLAARVQLEGHALTQKAISRIEAGDRIVPDYEIPLLAGALEISPLVLLGLKEEDT